MFELISCSLLYPFLLFILPLAILLLSFIKMLSPKTSQTTPQSKAYPIIGHLIDLYKLKPGKWFEWLASQVVSSPSSTFVLHTPFGGRAIYTGDPATVEHILKTHFPIYEKGSLLKTTFGDLFGDSLLCEDGEAWKFQRQVGRLSFTPTALQHYLDNAVDFEVSERLIPLLSEFAAKKEGVVLDLQDVLERFSFDTTCKTGFGYDPVSLAPSFPHPQLCEALNDAGRIIYKRFSSPSPIIWMICRTLNIKDEKRLSDAIAVIREFAAFVVKHNKQSVSTLSAEENNNIFLSRLLKYAHLDEQVIIDIMIATIYAGRDTTSAALTWFFWLLHNNKHVEVEILKEIKNKKKNNMKVEIERDSKSSLLEEAKEMAYTRAALCETMRLYPPVPLVPKQANRDDVLPNGTLVKKGTLVCYFPYAMGRMEKLWGTDCSEFRPERWLDKEEETGKWRFMPRDSYSYPVFQAGPRICLGKEMALLQMAIVIARVLGRFKVVPAVEEGFEPVYVPGLTANMQGGFPVNIQERSHSE